MIGRRIRLISIDDEFTDLKQGDEGVVKHIDDLGQIHVAWDKGSNLALIPEFDSYELL